MIDKELAARHLEYSLWASLEVLRAAKPLSRELIEADRGNSFGGILDTLRHIFKADRIWSLRVAGDPYVKFDDVAAPATIDGLEAEWPDVLNGFASAVRAMEPARLAEPLFWRNIRGEDKSERLGKILLHIVNHGTYHRGQVITMIRQAGGAPVSTDLVYYPGM
jgi:uncharacterized damage-inducible protein DinB